MGSRTLPARLSLLLLLLPGLLHADTAVDKKQQKLNAEHADAIAAARPAAEAWLKIQDAEAYDKSWEAAADYFHQQVPEKGWEKRMQIVRKSIDPVLSREFVAAEWKTELPNLPAGEYVALVWETVFVSGQPQLETVVMLHQGSAWKMVGYAVQ